MIKDIQAQQTFTASAGGGFWSQGTSWEGGVSPGFNVGSNVIVDVPAGRSLALSNPILINNGTIQISGILNVSSGSGTSTDVVTIINNGNMTVNAGGIIAYVNQNQNSLSKDIITNNGTFINSGLIDAPITTLTQREFNNTSTGILRNLNGTLKRRLNLDVTNEGTMQNTGVFEGLHSLTNSGSVTNTSGALTINPALISANRPNDGVGRLDNLAGGILTNAGTITITSEFTDSEDFTAATNNGTITNQTGGTILVQRSSSAQVSFTNDAGFNNNGTLTITNAILTNNSQLNSSFIIFNNGTLTNAGTMSSMFMNNNGVLNNTGFFTIAANGILSRSSGTPTITNSGNFTVAAGASLSLIATTMNNIRSLTAAGSISISVDALLVNNNTAAPNGGVLIQSSGRLDISAGGEFRNEVGTVEISGDVDNSGTINNGGSYFNNGPLTNTTGSTLINNGGLSISFFGGSITNSGTITSNGSLTVQGPMTNNSGATITNGGTLTQRGNIFNFFGGTITNANSGAISINDDIFNNQGTLDNLGMIAIATAGTLGNITITNNSGTIINNGTLFNSNTTNNLFTNNGILTNNNVFTNNGILSGINTTHTGNFDNTGTLSPGNTTTPTGVYALNNDYTHSASTLSIEMGSTSTFDNVAVTGTANLSGTLTLSLLNGFVPSVGDSFTILTAGAVSGTFATINAPTLTNSEFDIIYTPTSVIATVSSCITTTYTIAGGWDNGAPDANKKAVINEDYNTSTMGLGDITACALTVSNEATLTISADNFALIEHDITVETGASLIVEHTGSVVQVDDTAIVTNNGTINVNVTTPMMGERDFIIMGSPMTNESRNDVFQSANVVRHHLTDQFEPHPQVANDFPFAENFADDNTNTSLDWPNFNDFLNPAEGYFVRPHLNDAPDAQYSFVHDSGTLNSGIITYDLAMGFDGTQNGSPNILANPYASAISATAFMAANGIGELFFWEHLTQPTTVLPGQYPVNFSMEDISSINAAGIGNPAATAGGTTPTNVLSSMQGFGLKALAAGPATFNNGMRIVSANNTLREQALIERDIIRLTILNTEYERGGTTTIAFLAEATANYDAGIDNKRLATVVSLYSHLEDGSKEFGIQSREIFNEEIKIPLGFSTLIDRQTSYKISVSDLMGVNLIEATPYLADNYLGTITNLKEADYEFTSNKGSFNSRFTLLFKGESVLGTSELDFNLVSIFPNPTNGLLNVVSPQTPILGIEVFDLRGRKVLQTTIDLEMSYKLDVSKLDSALYFIAINTPEGLVTKQFLKE